MRIVTFGVSSFEETMRRTKVAAGKREPQASRISFETPELMFSLMTPRRWEIIRAMAGEGTMSIRELARRLDRDVKQVHGDVHALLEFGVLQKDEDRIVFPYDGIHVDFTVKPDHAAA